MRLFEQKTANQMIGNEITNLPIRLNNATLNAFVSTIFANNTLMSSKVQMDNRINVITHTINPLLQSTIIIPISFFSF